MHDFKSIGVYFDEDGNLIGVPSSIVKKWNALVDIDGIVRLSIPYGDGELESFLKTVFDECYSQTLKELPKQSALQRYLGVKSYTASIEGLGFVSLRWLKSEGYKVTPTWQNARQKSSFDHMDDKTIQVANGFLSGELANALRKAMKLSPIGPLNTRPE
jgi:hypothetical protein